MRRGGSKFMRQLDFIFRIYMRKPGCLGPHRIDNLWVWAHITWDEFRLDVRPHQGPKEVRSAFWKISYDRRKISTISLWKAFPHYSCYHFYIIITFSFFFFFQCNAKISIFFLRKKAMQKGKNPLIKQKLQILIPLSAFFYFSILMGRS